MEIDLKSKIEILELSAWMDGGSVTLKCKNDLDQNFEIEFVQNVIWIILRDYKLTGRLYLNEKLIPQRSKLEFLIVENLQRYAIKTLKKLEKAVLKEKIDYILSENYLTDTKKV